MSGGARLGNGSHQGACGLARAGARLLLSGGEELEWAAVQERTRLQGAAELAIMFAGCLGGVLHLPAGVVVVGLGVLLLFVSDRGQHRELADKAPQRPRWVVIGFSMMAYLTLNMVAIAACYVLGGLVGWVFL